MYLKKLYQEKVVPILISETPKGNVMALPKITKVSINVSLKEALKDKGVIAKVSEQLQTITGQKPRINKARLSIANFKLREGDVVGVSATLRGKRMDDFLTKLVTIALPRVRDFQGISLTAFDGRGNYTLGLTEQIVFPEIEYTKVDRIRGLQITICTNTGDDKMAKRLMELLGFPFEKGDHHG